MRSWIKITLYILGVCLLLAIGSYFYLPVNRVSITSELVMLGDFDGNNVWNANDSLLLQNILSNPFSHSGKELYRADINRNGLIDEEDLFILRSLYQLHDPYFAEEKGKENGHPFPKPRELYQFIQTEEMLYRPLFHLPADSGQKHVFSFSGSLLKLKPDSDYEEKLIAELYDEATRFEIAYQLRKNDLTAVEMEYANRKILVCEQLFKEKKYYDLLLHVMALVEDAETLTSNNQPEIIQKLLLLRDDLQTILISKDFNSLKDGRAETQKAFSMIEPLLVKHLNMVAKLDSLESPRDLSKIENYFDRAEWQFFKSKTTSTEFKSLIKFAQYDRRYIRAVSFTTPKLTDSTLMNHNLPMIILYREALRITKNDKKAAAGLLDEIFRIPMGWVKSIPKEYLPGSLAMDNFLLPGNKEDGLDKSRHWNVFGAISLYKSPRESFDLALKREIRDLRDDNFSHQALKEFIRDTIANLNGIYYVVALEPKLIYGRNSEK